MINKLLHSLPPTPSITAPCSSNRYEFVYMQMSHHRHRAVASTCRLHTQWQSSAALTRTSQRASSSGTSWTGTGWRRPPSRSQGLPCRCQSPLGHPSWTHLEGKGNEGCDALQCTKTGMSHTAQSFFFLFCFFFVFFNCFCKTKNTRAWKCEEKALKCVFVSFNGIIILQEWVTMINPIYIWKNS